MGLFDFFRRDAGRKLGAADAPKAEDITQELSRLGLDAQGVEVAVDGETVSLKGQASSQEQREKIVLAAGNVHGVSKVDDQLVIAQPTPPSQFYTVAAGDTLSKIAKQFYHDANKYPAIFEANRPMLKDPDEIYPGQVLRIPPTG